MFHVVPALGLGMSVRSFLRQGSRAREFGIKARIDFRKWMNDRLGPIMVNDLDRRDLARCIAVNKLLSRLREPVSVKDRCANREYDSASNRWYEGASHGKV